MFARDKTFRVAAALAIVLLPSFIAVAGLAPQGEETAPTAAEPRSTPGLYRWPTTRGATSPCSPSAGNPPPPASGLFQVRCWQFGRLLFEQNGFSLAGLESGGYGIKLIMSGTDRYQRPIYVAETRNATCLIRSAIEERSWPR